MARHDLTPCSHTVHMYCTYYNMFKLEVRVLHFLVIPFSLVVRHVVVLFKFCPVTGCCLSLVVVVPVSGIKCCYVLCVPL